MSILLPEASLTTPLSLWPNIEIFLVCPFDHWNILWLFKLFWTFYPGVETEDDLVLKPHMFILSWAALEGAGAACVKTMMCFIITSSSQYLKFEFRLGTTSVTSCHLAQVNNLRLLEPAQWNAQLSFCGLGKLFHNYPTAIEHTYEDFYLPNNMKYVRIDKNLAPT